MKAKQIFQLTTIVIASVILCSCGKSSQADSSNNGGSPTSVNSNLENTSNSEDISTNSSGQEFSKISSVDGMEMVFIPEGEFTMGADSSNLSIPKSDAGAYVDSTFDDQPVHKVYLDNYWIDKYEVTNNQYAKCVNAGVCKEPGNNEYYSNSLYAQHPVVYVDWYDAQNYCTWVERRLPSEAEWEKAARGIDERNFPWGNDTPDENLLNFDGNMHGTTIVGSYPEGASPYGVLDMAGNVWEWCSDWYDHEYYQYSPKENPKGPEDGDYKVMRGGSYLSGSAFLRSSLRDAIPPYASTASSGFRCVVNP